MAGGAGSNTGAGAGAGRSGSRISALSSALLEEESSGEEAGNTKEEEEEEEEEGGKEKGDGYPRSRVGGGLIFPSQGANLQPLVRNAPLPASRPLSSKKNKASKGTGGGPQKHKLKLKLKPGEGNEVDDGGTAREGFAAAAPRSKHQEQHLLAARAVTSHTSTSRLKRPSTGRSTSTSTSTGSATAIPLTRPPAPVQNDDSDWFFTEGW